MIRSSCRLEREPNLEHYRYHYKLLRNTMQSLELQREQLILEREIKGVYLNG